MESITMNKNTDLYKQAKEIIVSNNNYSVSFLQRKLQVSYNRASELMQMLQKSEAKKITIIFNLTLTAA